MSKRIYHMIGNTHIDPVWLWKRAEGFQEVKSSFSSALERMKEFPDFIFTVSSVSYLAWLSENCPTLFEEIRERIQEGRFEIAGGMWVEPDCILPAGESLIRHFLYSGAFLENALGISVSVGYNVDSFGHGANFPAILSGCGIRAYAATRPAKNLFAVPPVFRWRSPDGSEVLAERIAGDYLAWTKPGIELNLRESEEALDAHDGNRMAVFYGVGNHGGGPTIDNIKSIRELRQQRTDAQLDFSRLDGFFAALNPDELPVYEGEWGRVFTGCYSSDNEIKRLNRAAEWGLLKAEAILSIASCFTREKPSQRRTQQLEDAWKDTLFNQFHDILSGTSIEPARDEACDSFRGSIAAANRLIGDGVQAIANSLDTRGDGFPLVLANPTGKPFSGVFCADVYVPASRRKQLRLRDTDGEELPYAETAYRCYAQDSRKGILFQATVPAMGYAVYRMLHEGPNRRLEESAVSVGENCIQNELLTVTLDAKTGCPASICKNGQELLEKAASILVCSDDRGAWGQHPLVEQVEGSFSVQSFEVVEQNPLRGILRAILSYQSSTLVLDYILETNSDKLRINGTLHNLEKHTEICLSLPLAGQEHRVCTETAFLTEEKVQKDGTEYYQHRFADIVAKGGCGIAVLNNCAYGMRQLGQEYRLILSRSSVFARGEDGPLPITPSLRAMDQGKWDFTLCLIPHTDELTSARLFAEADFLHMPVEYLADSNHPGSHSLRTGSALTVHGEGVAVSSLKPALSGEGLVLRLFETEGVETAATILHEGKSHEIPLLPHQIRSFFLRNGKLESCNMVERNG